ncbi:hypothetical protein ACHAWT_007729 [Skeletonema menzelii]
MPNNLSRQMFILAHVKPLSSLNSKSIVWICNVGIPKEIEDGFHDFDIACTACAIDRKATEGAEDCPVVVETCDKGPGDDGCAALILNVCGTDCSSDQCKDLYFTLRRIQHDKCDHDTISSASEDGMHDLEVPCGIHKCN